MSRVYSMVQAVVSTPDSTSRMRQSLELMMVV